MTKIHEQLYHKGREIFDVVKRISDLIPEDDTPLQSVKEFMQSDALLLSVKVKGVEETDLYDLNMEAATIIRKAARDLMIQNHTLKMFGFKYVDYFDIVRELIEEYRLLFIQWVTTFDPWNYVTDRWGLFNPPGVGPNGPYSGEDLPDLDG